MRLIYKLSKIINLSRALFLLLVFTTIGHASSQQQTSPLTKQEMTWIKANPIVRVGGGQDWAPFDFVNENGEYDGIVNDYLKLLSKNTGLKFVVEVNPWHQTLNNLSNGKIDLIGALNYTQERAQSINYGKPYFDQLDYFFVRSDLNVIRLEDLNGKRVAIPKGYAFVEFFAEHFPKIKIITVNTFHDAIDMVLENKADMLYDTYAVVSYTLSKEKINTIIPFKSTRHLQNNPLYMATRKGAPELDSIIQKGMDTISNEEHRAINDKWLGYVEILEEQTLNLTHAEKEWIKTHPIVHFGAEKDWAPYDFVNQQGKYDGVANDYLKLISNISGLRFKPLVDDWNILLEKTRNNELDLLASIYISDSRREYLAFSDSYQTMLNYFFVRDDLDVNTIDDLAGYTVAIPKSYRHIEVLKQQFPKLKILETDTLNTAVEAVIEGRADILLEVHSVLNFLLKKLAITNIRPFKALPTTEISTLHMAAPKSNFLLISIINKALASIPESKKTLIYDKWLGSHRKKESQRITFTKREQQWLSEHPVIRLGTDENSAPYEFIDGSGQLRGFSIEVVKLIEQQLGIQFKKISRYKWANTLEKAKNKEIDLISGIVETDNRRKYLNFSIPYFSRPVVIFSRKNNNTISNFGDLKGKTLSIENQFFLHEKLAEKFPEINLVTVETTAEALKALSYGEVDAYIGDHGATNWIAAQNVLVNLREIGDVNELGASKISFGVRKDWPIFISILNKAIDSIPAEEMLFVQKKWLGISPKTPQLNFTIEEQQWLNNHPIATFTGNPNWLPYEAFDEYGNYIGIVADYLKNISDQTSIQFETTRPSNWSQALQLAQNKKIDVIPGDLADTTLNINYSPVNAYLDSPIVIIMDNQQPYVDDLNQIKEKKIAFIKGYGYTTNLLKQYPDIDFIEVENIHQGLEMLSNSSIDVMLASRPLAEYSIAEMGLYRFKIVGKTNVLMEVTLFVTKDKPLLKNIIQKALNNIPIYQRSKILRRWNNLDEVINNTIKLSSSERKWLDEHKTIRFTGDPNWLPYEAFDKQGNYIGIVAEHLKIIEKKLAIKLNIVPTQSWEESIDKVKQGEIDIISEASGSELNSILSFTQDYLSSPIVIVMRNDEDYVENIDQIKNRTIAVIQNYGYVPKIISKYPEIEFELVSTIQDGLTAVSTGKVEALLATLAQASYHISDQSIHNIRIVGKTEFKTKLVFGIRKELDPLVPLFNRALNDIKRIEKQRILNVWGKHKFVQQTDYALIFKITAAFIIIILLVVYWNRTLAKEVIRRQELEAQTQALMDNIPLPVIVMTYNGRILSANPQATSEYALEPKHINTLNISNFYENSDDRDSIIREIKEKKQVKERIVQVKKLDGTRRSMLISVITAKFNNLPALLAISVDLTERLEMEEAIKKNNFYSDIALELTSCGHWHVNYKDPDYYYQSERAAKLLGEPIRKDGRVHIASEWFPRLLEANPEIAQETLDRYQKTIEGKHTNHDSIYPYKRQDNGKIIWVHSFGKTVRDNQGKIQFMYGVYQDITQQKEAQLALGNAKQAAEAATRAKSEFLANMSHEIRTPMNAIIGFTELLNEQITEPKLKSFVETIRSAGNNLLTLINDILDLSKIEAGKLQIEKSPCNPHNLFEELGNIFMMKMHEKNIDFVLNIDPIIPSSLLLDSTRLRQVLFNLVGNAVKFTNQGTIRINARTNNEDRTRSILDLIIDVEDSGIGIHKDQQELIFQDFEQSSGQDTKEYGGTGLGLSISKRLVEMMGGKLSLKSKLNKGSTFTVNLVNVDVASISIDPKNKNSCCNNSITFLPAKILIVDDIRHNRELLQADFANTPISVVAAENGLKAVELAKRYTFDLILMDIRMPVMDGYQAANRIKSFSKVPIVALTASVMMDEFDRLKDNNFDGYLRKPVFKEILFEELRRFLPFKEIKEQKGVQQEVIILNDNEQKNLVFVLDKLMSLTEQSFLISKSNNILEIKNFAKSILDITEHHPISLIVDYAKQLESDTESFNIAAIRRSINSYPQIISQLKQLK